MSTRFSFGRFPSPPDARDYRLGDFLRVPATVPEMTFWDVGRGLDQGLTPHCVGFSGAHWSNAAPVENTYGCDDGHALYKECKIIDGQPGYENGSCIRSLAKVLRARGRLDAYAFGDVTAARLWLLTQGPVVFGIDWYEGMSEPAGFDVVPSGEFLGGHAVLAYAATPEHCYFQNSWGTAWGIVGCCRMRWIDLEYSFGSEGEAMTAVELPLDAPVPPPEPAPLPWWVRFWLWLCRVFG